MNNHPQSTAPNPMTPERLEHLIALTVSNMRAENQQLSDAEIAQVRTNLKARYGLA